MIETCLVDIYWMYYDGVIKDNILNQNVENVNRCAMIVVISVRWSLSAMDLVSNGRIGFL
jgi:hypothetical protein